MAPNIKFYKILLLNNFLEHTNRARTQLLSELAVNATDPILYKRRFRMLAHLSEYENQIIKKIQDFETDDILDLSIDDIFNGLSIVLNKNA